MKALRSQLLIFIVSTVRYCLHLTQITAPCEMEDRLASRNHYYFNATYTTYVNEPFNIWLKI